MVTNVTEVKGARVIIACMPSGRVRGAAVWESKDGQFHALLRETVQGDLSHQFHYEGDKLDYASEWAANHISRIDTATGRNKAAKFSRHIAF